jgi:hypothetical protein
MCPPNPPRSSEFLTPLVLRLQARGLWIVAAPLTYYSEVAEMAITVPVDFISDLASVPRLPLTFALAGGRAPQSSVLHDWLYQHPDWDDRELADMIFFESSGLRQPALGYEPEPTALREAMYAALRAAGWWAWRKAKHRAEKLNPIWSASSWPRLELA